MSESTVTEKIIKLFPTVKNKDSGSSRKAEKKN